MSKYTIDDKELNGEDALECLELDVRVFNALKRDGAVTVEDVHELVNSQDGVMRLAQSAMPKAGRFLQYDSKTHGFVEHPKAYMSYHALAQAMRCLAKLSQQLRYVKGSG